MPTRIRIPNQWAPRPHQRRLWAYLQSGGRRSVAVWHRRAGKDSVAINWSAVAALQRRAVYWHMLPEAAQGRKVVWDAIDKQGRRVIDQAFPPEIRKSTNNTEMKIELINGSIWQVVGSDNYNSLIGSNPYGITYSEYSVAKPSSWDYLRPILAENGGWALFIYTPRGRNHGYKLFELARNNPTWFAELLTVNDTSVLDPSIIDAERAAGMDDSMIEQEYYCSFEGARVGSYYGKIINELNRAGRITSVEHDPVVPVYTYWDLGYSDDTAIWFAQAVRGELHIIDYYASQGHDIQHYVDLIRAKSYRYGLWHWIPHDARAKTLSANGRSTEQQLNEAGLRTRIVPELTVQDGIQAVRVTLPLCWFDLAKTQDGVEMLRQYQREWDDVGRMFKDRPKHDSSSHAADAFRYLALAWREEIKPPPPSTPRFALDQTFNEIRDMAKRKRMAYED